VKSDAGRRGFARYRRRSRPLLWAPSVGERVPPADGLGTQWLEPPGREAWHWAKLWKPQFIAPPPSPAVSLRHH